VDLAAEGIADLAFCLGVVRRVGLIVLGLGPEKEEQA
jgi:hypothetical protein